jgi:hypothetical protein
VHSLENRYLIKNREFYWVIFVESIGHFIDYYNVLEETSKNGERISKEENN